MSRDDKLISIRHCCFVRGVLGRSPHYDFRQAFRTMNRLYVDAKRDALKGTCDTSKPPATRIREAA